MTLPIAHRGSSKHFPENSAPAFEEALKHPIWGIECDFQLSADEFVVCYHDRSLSKLGKPTQNVHNLTYQELKSLDSGLWKGDAFRGLSLLTLEDVLTLYGPRTHLLLEIKVREFGPRLEKLGEKVVSALRAAGQTEKHFILCFDLNLLHHLAKLEPNLKLVLNTELDCTKKLKPTDWHILEGVSFRIEGSSPEASARCHQRGKRTFGYTCNTQNQLKKAVDSNLMLVMSDDPEWFIVALELM